MKSQRDFRNYLAGAALAFGIVLLVSQVLQLLYGRLAPGDRESVYTLIMGIYIASHIVGGHLGGYLVARVRRSNYLLTGTVTAVLAYIFEFAYNLIVEATLTDIYAMVSLLIGAVIGAMFMRAKMENVRIAGSKGSEKAEPHKSQP